ncbi:hypothetical protein FHU37_002640 [Allostreptomyces psammosilenae]|uniref:DUF6879 domain-containing protein n=1 Tax=Allostreptomyces psammosilenae TaxID=1892865 RepID=A0A852ZVM5_9ACTN|nr:hypothetical protein [Allostreptomyces psammosilenae]
MVGDDWQKFFDSFQHDAFRLETHPVYTMAEEQEEFDSFLATGELNIPDDDPWLIRVRSFRHTGRSIGRVHVIRRPLTDYLRYEFAVYAYTARAGEEVRILDLTDMENPGIPQQDFWMFDDSSVVLMHYREDGTQISRELLTDPDLAKYREWKDLAVSLSVPFAEYIQG